MENKRFLHDLEKPRRKSVRIPGYDYSKPGAYYLTICVQKKEFLFGDVVNSKMRLNEFGNVVQEEWLRTEEIRTYVELDESIIMPNHFHGLLFVTYNCRGMARRAPTNLLFQSPTTVPPPNFSKKLIFFEFVIECLDFVI